MIRFILMFLQEIEKTKESIGGRIQKVDSKLTNYTATVETQITTVDSKLNKRAATLVTAIMAVNSKLVDDEKILTGRIGLSTSS